MLGILVLLVLLGIEIGFMICCIVTKSYQEDKKNIFRISLLTLFILLVFMKIIQWNFRWYLLLMFLLIKLVTGIRYYIIDKKRLKEKKIFNKKRVIISFIRNVILLVIAITPAIIFPQFRSIEVTGDKQITTVSYTLTDTNRIETYSDNGESRKITIQFWYPEDTKEQYPLLLFSHGAFGFRGSNISTYKELASNGYVVGSIDHTYHSFYTKQTDGKSIVTNMEFLNDAIAVQNGDYDEEKTYALSQEWINIRMNDVNLVLEDIMNNINNAEADEVYKRINPEKIGLFGHSLGGATAAELGRQRSDIDAVVVIDGTMLGEKVGFKDGKSVLNSTPYPIPILNIYNEAHYKEATQDKKNYENMVATAHGVDAREVVIKGSGHLNFTDLPLLSPFLASLLGTGEVDSRYCIQTMNQITLDYFNYYLKGGEDISFQSEY